MKLKNIYFSNGTNKRNEYLFQGHFIRGKYFQNGQELIKGME